MKYEKNHLLKFFICKTILLFQFEVYGLVDKKINSSDKIAIIGAGASGLSAAFYLKEKGYKNITILERSERIGGKCFTIKKNGRSYEMGAIMLGPTYKNVLNIAEKYGLYSTKFSEGSESLVEVKLSDYSLTKIGLIDKIKFLKASAKYKSIYKKYRTYIDIPGFYEVNDQLVKPLSEFLKIEAPDNHKLIEKLLAHSFTSFGYGRMSEVPAIYVLKYFGVGMLSDFMFGRISMMTDGYQKLWESVAKDHNVELGVNVSGLSRVGDKWEISSNKSKKLTFDKVILTIPLDSVSYMMKLPKQISKHLKKIKYQYYYSLLVDTKGLYRGQGVIPENYESTSRGGLVSWLRRYSDSDLANFYYLSDEKLSLEEVELDLLNFSKKLNFKINSFEKTVRWRYFPYFRTSELKANIYRKLSEYNGTDGLFFAGEIMSFSTVQHTVDYSKYLIDKHFSSTKELSYSFPNYNRLTAKEKKLHIWNKIKETEYKKLPSYEELDDSMIKGLLSYLPKELNEAFENNNDFLIKGRNKVIHKLGSTALFKFKSTHDKYQDFSGIIRLSNAVNPSEGIVYPSFSIKILRDASNRSVNFNIGKSFDKQMHDNGEPDFNFFKDSGKFPFSNELVDAAKTGVGKVFRGIFKIANSNPHFVPVEGIRHFINNEGSVPRRLIFRAPENIQKLIPSEKYLVDERTVFNSMKAKTLLFDVFESSGLEDDGIKIGEIITDSKFISSSFGDKNLYFRHER